MVCKREEASAVLCGEDAAKVEALIERFVRDTDFPFTKVTAADVMLCTRVSASFKRVER